MSYDITAREMTTDEIEALLQERDELQQKLSASEEALASVRKVAQSSVLLYTAEMQIAAKAEAESRSLKQQLQASEERERKLREALELTLEVLGEARSRIKGTYGLADGETSQRWEECELRIRMDSASHKAGAALAPAAEPGDKSHD